MLDPKRPAKKGQPQPSETSTPERDALRDKFGKHEVPAEKQRKLKGGQSIITEDIMDI